MTVYYDRRDKCKCGRYLRWNVEQKIVRCKACGTEYEVDCDSVLVYWLKEKIKEQKPYVTEPR